MLFGGIRKLHYCLLVINSGKSVYSRRHEKDILEANGQTVEGFVFIAVEKTPPYAVAVYVIEDEDIARGREKYMENLKVWRECKQKNEWPGLEWEN
jgi:hypothetical protein